MDEKTKAHDKEKMLELGMMPTRNVEEILEEVSRITTIIATAGQPLAEAFAHDFNLITHELIHWAYDVTQKHAAPSVLLFEQIEKVQQEIEEATGEKKERHYDA